MAHTTAEIDLAAVRSNLQAIRANLKPWVEIIALVKGNAYGHGAVEVSRSLVAAGAHSLGVAFVSEAVELRQAGITCPILIVGSFCKAEVDTIVEYGVTTSISDLALAKELAAAARRRNRRMPVHIEVDTGMGRMGIRAEQAPWLIDNLRSIDGLIIEGIFTHFSSADEADQSYSRHQLRKFMAVMERVRERGVAIPVTHVQNSAGILNLPEVSFTAVRPGLSLYGLYPSSDCHRHAPLKPVLSLHSRVALVKRTPPESFVSYNRTYKTPDERNLATIAIGYADGLPRELSSKGRVLIRGRSYPIVGRVTMDHIVVDLNQDNHIHIGDRVTIIGRDGEEEITADELAHLTGTISYEITTGISHRVMRLFREAGVPQVETPAKVAVGGKVLQWRRR